jgi:Family of unknown function (DUF6200)
MAPTPQVEDQSQSVSPVIVKLGRQSRKRIKRLSEGRGKLFGEVMETIEELRKSGQISATAQPLIFVVKQDHEFSILG